MRGIWFSADLVTYHQALCQIAHRYFFLGSAALQNVIRVGGAVENTVTQVSAGAYSK
ncbi:hypothetical protein R84865_000932 [Carnimonas sp. R-84865]